MTTGEHEGDHFEGGVTQKAVAVRPNGDVLLVGPAVDSHDWTLPGGRMEDDETATAGLRRELREETGLDVRVERPVLAMRGGWVDSDGNVLFTVIYRCKTLGGEVSLNHEHDDYAWMSPAEAARQPPYEFLETAVNRATTDREAT